jgi:hypothetical protein
VVLFCGVGRLGEKGLLMNTWTKLSIIAALAVVGGAAATMSACTVTSTSTTDDGGTDEAGNDAGTDSNAVMCVATQTCGIIGDNGSTQTEFAKPCSDSKGCNTCMAVKCCGQTTACFMNGGPNADDAGHSDCRQLFDCYGSCLDDAGMADPVCQMACTLAHGDVDGGTYALANAVDTCRTTNCATQCP